MNVSPWELSWRTDARARALADRHYSRQTIGATGFAPPGRCLVLIGAKRKAYWVTSWPFAQYVKHEWAGAWLCSAFRNEGEGLSSDLIRWAVAATVYMWPEAPSVTAVTGGACECQHDWKASACGRCGAAQISVAMVTFVDTGKVRKKRDPGRCYRRADFVPIGYTKGGLYALGLPVDSLPEPTPPSHTQVDLFGGE